MTNMSLQEIIEYAILREEEAYTFYKQVAEMSEKEPIRELFLAYAKEELVHKAKLQKLDIGQVGNVDTMEIANLKIAEHVEEIEPTKDMSYQDALILGMQKEKDAYILYMGLAASTDDPTVKELFNVLAQEEAKHKLHFETQYDEFILKEN